VKGLWVNPFSTLGVDDTADDNEIRQAYLSLVRRYPPEQNPERFQYIHNAYESIKNGRARHEYVLFSMKTEYRSPGEVLAAESKLPHTRKPLSPDHMKEFLRQCSRL
jgi:DnaJ-class molecular chaperone